jgi:hypothetical protein
MWPVMFGTAYSKARCSARPAMFGLLRATGMVVCVSLTLLGCLLATANAKVGESMVHFGEQLAELTQAKTRSAEGLLHINGLEIHRITASTPLDVKEALNRLQNFCGEHGGLETPTALLKSTQVKSIQPGAAARGGTYRHESEHAGVIACIDTQRPLGVAELATRLQEFVNTGNLSVIGSLRYVLARREKSVTSLLVLWTAGDAPVLRMFPKTGDAPGYDVPDVPRPAQATRVFSASEDGVSYSVTTYQSSADSAASAIAWYKPQLQQRGWRVTGSKQPSTLIAQRGSRIVVISSTLMNAGSVAITIAEL